jgi:hypothetical protein
MLAYRSPTRNRTGTGLASELAPLPLADCFTVVSRMLRVSGVWTHVPKSPYAAVKSPHRRIYEAVTAAASPPRRVVRDRLSLDLPL